MIKYGFLCYSLEEILFEDKLNDVLIDAILVALPTPYCPLIKTLSDKYLMSSIPLISFFLKKKLDEKSLLITRWHTSRDSSAKCGAKHA